MFRKVPIVTNEYYHLYSRGVDKRLIFLDEIDHERFIKLLFLCNAGVKVIMEELRDYSFPELVKRFGNRPQLTAIGAYCLMPNHFHILVREKEDGGTSRFMHKLLTAYSMYFNKKHKRTGALFESRFKSSHINNDNYLQYLFAYIHLNPVKLVDPTWKEEGIADIEKSIDFLEKYSYSSYHDYRGAKRPENTLLNRSAFPEYFENHTKFEHFIESWLTYGEEKKLFEGGVQQLVPAAQAA